MRRWLATHFVDVTLTFRQHALNDVTQHSLTDLSAPNNAYGLPRASCWAGRSAKIGRPWRVAEILGMKFSGIIAWWLWRGIYLSKLPGFQKKVRARSTGDAGYGSSLKDIVQLPTFALAHDFASGGSVQTPRTHNQQFPKVEQEEDEV
jgi:hypothetical protein